MREAENQKKFPCRKSPRAYFHDYSGGAYFIMICTEDKAHYFGEIIGGEMIFSAIGKFCEKQFMDIQFHYPYIEIPLYTVMPNHVHALVIISDKHQRTHEPCVPTFRTLLSVMVAGLKRSVTMYARRNNILFGWQARYHDRIIRNMEENNRITEYIQNNVSRWDSDCFR